METIETTEEKKRRTITLTGRPPVRIVEEYWPILADASYHDYDNQHEFQAFRHWRGFVRVRGHEDGRKIVYSKCWHTTQHQGERDTKQSAGELLDPSDDVVEAIKRVHAQLDWELGGRGSEGKLLADECIADLPAEDI